MKWTSKAIHVDIETAQIITEEEAKKNYIKIKTKQYVTFNKTNTAGHTTYTNEYRRRAKQLQLFN